MSTESALNLAIQSQGITAPLSDPLLEPKVGPDSPTPEAPKELESTRFSHLAKKEAELVRQQQEFKKERDAILQERDKLKPLHDKLIKFEELKKTDPVSAIKMLEFSDNDFVNFLAAREDNSTPEEKARKAALDEIDKFKTEQQKEVERVQTENNNRVINEFKATLSTVMASDKERFELSNMIGKAAEELAFDYVKECVNLGTEPPSAEEAAEMVEKYYEDYFKEIMKSKKLSPQEAVAAAKEAVTKDEPLRAEVSPKPNQNKTLTSKVTATTASVTTRKETTSEKRDRLIRQLAGN